MESQDKIEEIAVRLKQYVNTSYELNKLEITERISVLGASLTSITLLLVIELMFALFTSISVAYYISNRLEDKVSGFAIVAGFYFLLGLIVIVVRKNTINKSLRDKIIRKITDTPNNSTIN